MFTDYRLVFANRDGRAIIDDGPLSIVQAFMRLDRCRHYTHESLPRVWSNTWGFGYLYEGGDHRMYLVEPIAIAR